MNVEIVIEGVADVRLEQALERRIRTVCREARRDGWSSVLVAPSETRGEWDVAMRTGVGRHFASFVDTNDRLPDLVGAQLLAWLT
jgi:hypothetical protein